MSNVAENKAKGNEFEALFKKQAQLSGLFLEKNELSAKLGWRGRAKLLKSELDFKLIDMMGRVGFFDAKCFEGEGFPYSHLDPNQIRRASNYNRWNVPSGFVVWFHEHNRIVFYSGLEVVRKGSRTSFTMFEGRLLGRYESFDLRSLLRPVA